MTACAGVVISINPVTTKIIQIAGSHFTNATLVGEVIFKFFGVLCIIGLSYLIGKELSKAYLKGFIVGTVALAALDLIAFIIASVK